MESTILEIPPQTKKLNPVSDEQNVIIQHILRGDNCVVDACAGSGKSTTILSMALLVPHLKILQITYNSELRKDVKKQIAELGIQNVKVHTFHSLAVKYYLTNAHTDSGIRKIIFDDLPPRETLPHYNIIVLDEAQDITFLYFQLMVKFTFNMGKPFQLFVLGDYMQGLYQFKGADTRFLTMCESTWHTHPLLCNTHFHKCTLQTSYRITNQMANFVNEVMLETSRLIACKDGLPVMYIRNSRKNLQIVVISVIKQLLDGGVCPSDIFVLGASVKGATSNIRKMENVLVESGIPCHVPMFETDKIDERVMQGKVVFSTFHSVKGRQRKYVFVMGFDQSYFSLYASNLPTNICPNTLYVGCTRATHQLFLLESDQYNTDRPLEFLKMTHHAMKTKPYIQFRGIPRSIFYKRDEDAQLSSKDLYTYHNITPTDLIKFVPETVIEDISPLLDKIFINETPELTVNDEISIPNIIETATGQFEDVSDINGIAIPSIYYDHIYTKYAATVDASDNPVEVSTHIGANILLQIIQDSIAHTKEHEYTYLKLIISQIQPNCDSVSDYLYLSNVFIAAKEKLYFKLKQIDSYNWLSESIVQQCLKRLDKFIGVECKLQTPLIEYQMIHYDMVEMNDKINEILAPHFQDTNKRFRFSARADLITDKCIWELKCTSTISIEHRLQLVIYDWLWKVIHDDREIHNPQKKYIRKSGKSKKARIVNIKTGERLRIDASFDELTHIVVSILKGKYSEYATKPDDVFVQDCLDYIDKLSNE